MNPALADLRDIHLPDPVSWWPLAPAWWILAGTIFVLLLGAICLFRYWKKHRYYRVKALKKLRSLDKAATEVYLRQVAELVKATALVKYPETASMTGTQWQQFLSKAMAEDIAQLLAVSRYQANPQFDATALQEAVARWIRSH